MTKEFRLLGPPGCGKTTALARSWLPKAAERFGADAVVVVSLTRTAAKEIAGRDIPLPRSNVGTLHSLAFRAAQRLGAPAEVADKRLAAWNERHGALALSAAPEPSDESVAVQGRTEGDRLRSIAETLRHRMVPRGSWPADVAAFQAAWEAWKGEEGVLDFTDMIELALDGPPAAPGSPAVLIVDEAQDCSALELALVRRWASSASYAVLCGDGDQAIYHFRGADPAAFLGSDLPQESIYPLEQSWRVPRAVHARASALIERASSRYAVAYRPRDHEGEVSEGVRAWPPEVVESVERDLEEGRSAMVLASCGYQLQGFTRALKDAGVPFWNPWRVSQGAWNPMRGGGSRLRGYLRPDQLTYETPRLWSAKELAAWLDVCDARKMGLARGAKTRAKELADRDVDPASGRSRSSPITPQEGREVVGEHVWVALMRAFARVGGDDPVAYLQRNLLASRAPLFGYAFRCVSKQGTRAVIDDPRVTIGTIHSVKGGEADSVYLLPDLSALAVRSWHLGSDRDRDAIIRTFYVGMTRARDRLAILRPLRRRTPTIQL